MFKNLNLKLSLLVLAFLVLSACALTPSGGNSVPPTPTQMAGYTLVITEPGDFPIPSGSRWTYVYCTNSTPELSAANGLQYTESDPLGTGRMWIGYPTPGQTLKSFKVSQELFNKMQAEAGKVAMWCEFK